MGSGKGQTKRVNAVSNKHHSPHYALTKDRENENQSIFKIKSSPNVKLTGNITNPVGEKKGEIITAILNIKDQGSDTIYSLRLSPTQIYNEALSRTRNKGLFSDEIDLVDGSNRFFYWEPNTNIVGQAKLFISNPPNYHGDYAINLISELSYKELNYICETIINITKQPITHEEKLAASNKALKDAVSTDVNF